MKKLCLITPLMLTLSEPTSVQAREWVPSSPLAYVSTQVRRQQLRNDPKLARTWNRAILELDFETINRIEADRDWPPSTKQNIEKNRQLRIQRRTARGTLKTQAEKEAFLSDPQNREIRDSFEEALASGDTKTLRKIERTYQWIPIPVHELTKASSSPRAQPDSPAEAVPQRQRLSPITDIEHAKRTFKNSEERLFSFLQDIKQAGTGNAQTQAVYAKYGYELPSAGLQNALYRLALGLTGWQAAQSFDAQAQQKLENDLKRNDYSAFKDTLRSQGFSSQEAEATSQFLQLVILLDAIEKDKKLSLLYAQAYHSANPKQNLERHLASYGVRLTPDEVELLLLTLKFEPELQPPPPAQHKAIPPTAPTPKTLFENPGVRHALGNANFIQPFYQALIGNNRAQVTTLLKQFNLPSPTDAEYTAMRELATGYEGFTLVQTYDERWRRTFSNGVRNNQRTIALTAISDADKNRTFPQREATWNYARLRQLVDQLAQTATLRQAFDRDIATKNYSSLKQRIQANADVNLNETEVKLFIVFYQLRDRISMPS